MSTPEHPTWSNHIAALFTAPYWVEPAEKRKVAAEKWIASMKSCDVDLSSYASVRACAMTIYQHLSSPTTLAALDQNESWPRQALEAFILWVSEGMRETDTAPINPISTGVILKASRFSSDQPTQRRDIFSLSDSELDKYRGKFDKAIKDQTAYNALCSAYNNYRPSTGAFIPWHRAHLLAFEALVDHPIPFWNFFAAKARDPTSAASGLPLAFLDLEYRDSKDKIVGNPLLLAPVPRHPRENLLKMPIRDPLLALGTLEGRKLRVEELKVHLADILNSLKHSKIPHRPQLDWLLWVLSGSIRTWVGGDMGLTARAAYDPLYWSFVANMDRISSRLISGYDATSTEQLQPFVLDNDTGKITVVENGGPETTYLMIRDLFNNNVLPTVQYASPESEDFVGK